MLSRKKSVIVLSNILKRFNSHQKHQVKIEFENEIGDIESKTFKPKQHPGIHSVNIVELPPNIVKAIKIALGDVPFKGVLNDSVKLANYLWSRNYPYTEKEEKFKKSEIEKSISMSADFDVTGKEPNEAEKIVKLRDKKINKTIKQTIHAWKNVQLDKYTALQYLVKRGPADYAVLYKIFNEINGRENNYKPTSYFDFGSGVGTGIWAAQQFWKNSLQEYFTIDTSSDANDLARLILCGGDPNVEVPIKKFFQKQYLPVSNVKFDVVLSAFSLFELPTTKNRLMTVQNLWNRTKDYLILVEAGTNAGFRMIIEARDFILEAQDGNLVGEVFAPCPHDLRCARYEKDTTPCNFPVRYKTLSFDHKYEHQNMFYSYVVLKKGKLRIEDKAWPRIVRPVLERTRHTICRMCCDDGKLKEVVFTKSKHGQAMYKCAKSSLWGDRLPINMTQGSNESPVENLHEITEETNDSDNIEFQETNESDDVEFKETNEGSLKQIKSKNKDEID